MGDWEIAYNFLAFSLLHKLKHKQFNTWINNLQKLLCDELAFNYSFITPN